MSNRNITTITNGFTVNPELKAMIERFEKATSILLPDWDIEHFYYGENLDMLTIRNSATKFYAHFNLTARRVSFNGHTLTRELVKTMESLTYNDELFNGHLMELSNI